MKKKGHNAADPSQVADKEQHASLGKKQRLKDIKSIMTTPEGVRNFQCLMEDGKVFHSSMTGNAWTYFNEGSRSLALKKLAEVVETFQDDPKVLGEIIVGIIIKQEKEGEDNG